MTRVETGGAPGAAGAHADTPTPDRTGPVAPTVGAHTAVVPVGCAAVTLHGGFWGTRQERNRSASIPVGSRRLREAGNLEDLRLAREPGDHRAAYHGPVFMDSDIYKWLEAVAWELGRAPDDGLRDELREWTAELAATQADDGYLNSWVQSSGDPSRRYRDLAMGHELYCFGHLIQAAIAARRAAGEPELLHVARRAADHLVATFGPEDNPGVEGHPVIEMALVELYRETGASEYLDLAHRLVRRRGHNTVHGYGRLPIYYSDRVPAEAAGHVEGHAVRALYFASGVADVAAELPADEAAGLQRAQTRQWEDMVATRMYLTGGFGSRWDGEAFGDAFELPVDRAYCETCAAIAAVQWSWRLLLATGEARYAELIERVLFNGFASGTSLAGDEFFYVNALRVRDGAVPDDDRNPAAGRHGWFQTACCPPNVMRTVAQLGGYLATHGDDTVTLQQYAGARVAVALGVGDVALEVVTDYPWDGRVEVTVTETPDAEWTLALRIPGWARGATVTVGDEAPTPAPAGDHVSLRRRFRAGERVVLVLPMDVRVTRADPRIDAIRGCAAIERGPLVYCFEDHDQRDGVSVDEIVLSGADAVVGRREDLLGGVHVIEVGGAVLRAGRTGLPYDEEPVALAREETRLIAVPYHAWANRGVRAMRVWVPLAEASGR